MQPTPPSPPPAVDFDAFWTPARLAALEANADPWMVCEATYDEWERPHPEPSINACCALAGDVLLLTEGLRHYQARAQAAEAALAALVRGVERFSLLSVAEPQGEAWNDRVLPPLQAARRVVGGERDAAEGQA